MKPNTKISRHVPIHDGYDDCIIVGPSPLTQVGPGEWPSSGGHSVVVAPVEFGDNKVMPADYIAQNFVVTPPPPTLPKIFTQTPTYADEPSPESVFAAHAKANPPVVAVRAEPVPLTKEEIAVKRVAAKKPRA